MKRKIEKALKAASENPGRKRRDNFEYEELDAELMELLEEEKQGRKIKFETLEVYGSKGQKYRITIPSGFVNHIPRQWKWDAQKYLVADLLSRGWKVSEILRHPEVQIKSRATIYAWEKHPEFREHVDALTLETGFARQRERIAGMKRVIDMVFDKLVKEMSEMKLTDKNVGALLNALSTFMKQLAQEKGEFVEQARIEQETTANVSVDGKMTTATITVDQYLASLSEDEREQMEKEFSKVADEYIRKLRGDSPLNTEQKE